MTGFADFCHPQNTAHVYQVCLKDREFSFSQPTLNLIWLDWMGR